MRSIEDRFPEVHFYNAALTEVQENVIIGNGTRIGSFSLIHQGATIGGSVTIGSHCNMPRPQNLWVDL